MRAIWIKRAIHTHLQTFNDDALVKIQISNADTHNLRVFWMCIYILAGSICMLPWLWLPLYNTRSPCKDIFTAATTYISIYLTQLLIYSLSLPRSPFTLYSARSLTVYACVFMYMYNVCVCICELQIPVGIFSVEHISYTIQTAINGHSERSRYIKVLYQSNEWIFFDEISKLPWKIHHFLFVDWYCQC